MDGSSISSEIRRLDSAGCVRSVLLLAAIAAVTAAHAQPAREMKQYTNASWRWSIAYPAGWTVESDYPGLVRIHSTAENALCSIHSGPMDRFNTVDELTDFLVEHDAKLLKGKGRKFVVLARRRITLPNAMAGNDVLVEIGPGGRSRRLHVLADGRGFAIDCEAYEKHWSRLDGAYRRVIASFTVAR
jgi:hypothetical protein